jgi:hypothetical protein
LSVATVSWPSVCVFRLPGSQADALAELGLDEEVDDPHPARRVQRRARATGRRSEDTADASGRARILVGRQPTWCLK